MPVFAFPLAFVGLLAAGGLAAVYLLRNRSRRQVVSSLMLWAFQTHTRHGGRILQKMQVPLLFLLEMVAIASLILAAAGPRVPAAAPRRLFVILDDSFSMWAGNDNSARARAEAFLLETLEGDNYVTQLILAGPRPTILGKASGSTAYIRGLLERWRCACPSSQPEKAIALASNLDPDGRILVLSDRPPGALARKGRIEWHSFGQPSGNFALISAVRKPHGQVQRVLLEVANYSDAPGPTVLTITGGNLRPKQIELQLGPNEARPVVFDLPAEAPAITARLSGDALRMDNEAALLPERLVPVRVAVKLSDKSLDSLVQRALAASDLARRTSGTPDLLITDRPLSGRAESDRTWRLEIGCGEGFASFVGPFVLDRTHPLTAGLSLHGVIWAGDPKRTLGGRAVVMAGNVMLVSDTERIPGGHDLRMQIQPGLSTLQETPNWPILFDNLLRWRIAAGPGIHHPNIRLGQNASLVLSGGAEDVRVEYPDGTVRTVSARQRRVDIPAARPGVYRVEAGELTHRFSCNAISPGESNLAEAVTGTWGHWDEIETFGRQYVSIAYVPALLAMAVLVAHLMVLARIGGHNT